MPDEPKEINLPDVVDDDPEAPDTDDVLDKDTDIAQLLGVEEAAEEEEGEEPAPASKADKPDKPQQTAEKPEAKPADTPKPADKPAKVEFTAEQQAALERILEARLARERETQEKRFEQRVVTTFGKTWQQIEAEQKQQRIQEKAYELGVDEEKATKLVEIEEENRRLRAEREDIQRKEKELEEQRKAIQLATTYESHKQQFLADTEVDSKVKSLAKKYAAEIDAFSNGGGIDYVTAAQVVLGSKLGEILRDQETATEQKTIKNVSERGKVAPESPGPAQSFSLSAEQKRMARAFGVPEKEYAEQLLAGRRAHRTR